MSHIHAVILAGGSGTRFWPASRRHKPKQLLSIAPGQDASLLEVTVRRLERWVGVNHLWVSTGAHLLEQTRACLPQLSPGAFVTEPCARNTAPCIAWATQLIALSDPEAVVVALPSDQHVVDEAAFVHALDRAVAQAEEGCIATLGVRPTRPETGYGYLKLGPELPESVYRVERFVEKPDASTAERYVNSGDYLWNSGIFVFQARRMLAAVARHMPELAQSLEAAAQRLRSDPGRRGVETRDFFEAAPSVSIDYGVMEHERELCVVPFEAGWSDLGSWEAVWDLSEKDAAGNASAARAVFIEASGNLAVDLTPESQQPLVALVGVQDLCVVRSGDALLVIPKQQSQKIRSLVDALKKQGLEGLL